MRTVIVQTVDLWCTHTVAQRGRSGTRQELANMRVFTFACPDDSRAIEREVGHDKERVAMSAIDGHVIMPARAALDDHATYTSLHKTFRLLSHYLQLPASVWAWDMQEVGSVQA